MVSVPAEICAGLSQGDSSRHWNQNYSYSKKRWGELHTNMNRGLPYFYTSYPVNREVDHLILSEGKHTENQNQKTSTKAPRGRNVISSISFLFNWDK